MSALLRWYGAEDALLDGSYQYPVVSKQAAVRTGGENGTSGTGNQSTPFDGSASGGFGGSVLAAVLTVASLGLAAFL
jgi:hypothetical protein